MTLAALVLLGMSGCGDDEQQPLASEKRQQRTGPEKTWQEGMVATAKADGSRSVERLPFANARPAALTDRQVAAARTALGRDGRLLGLRFDAAQYLAIAKGSGLWLVRGRGVVCMFDSATFAASCSTASRVVRRGLDLAMTTGVKGDGEPTGFRIVGVAPDGATAVRLVPTGSSRRVVPVHDNTFSIRSRRPLGVGKVIWGPR